MVWLWISDPASNGSRFRSTCSASPNEKWKHLSSSYLSKNRNYFQFLSYYSKHESIFWKLPKATIRWRLILEVASWRKQQNCNELNRRKWSELNKKGLAQSDHRLHSPFVYPFFFGWEPCTVDLVQYSSFTIRLDVSFALTSCYC